MFTLILLLAITTASFTGINANKVARDRNDTLSGSRAKSRVFSYVADVVVETTHGKIRGVQEIDTKTGRHVTSFYGIPFAEPPVKRNRFMPPVPVQPWEDTIDCTQKKLFQVCPQIPIGDLSYGREDCLYMNIYVPSDGTNFNATKLPVFMWLYGGAYVFGDKDELGFYDGKNLATSRNVVVVEPNYRVGALGFMSLDAVSQRTGGTTGNQGLQDQRQAMQFAYTNLDRFGGDNTRVVLAGESAGAFSVCWHLVSPLSKFYFTAAIMQSGTCSSRVFFVERDRARVFSNEVADHAGCDPTAPAADLLNCMQDKDYRDFFMTDAWPIPVPGTNHSIIPPIPVMGFGPTIDGDIRGLRKLPLELLRERLGSPVPLLHGTNLDEGTIFVPIVGDVVEGITFPLTDEEVVKILNHFFNESTSSDILLQYEGIGNLEKKMNAVLRDFFFLCPNQYISEAFAAHGHRSWLYQFTMPLRDWEDYNLLGDYHTLEIPFVFDNEWPPVLHSFGRAEQELADGVGMYWTNLARFGDVNGGDVPLHWPEYDTSTRINLDLTIPLRTATFLQSNVCEFWRSRDTKF
eukprot:m.283728 g.283728  ORF g.283728 m.283728 type:complete len:574 (-) comp19883_c0_seq1:365-2086(-)